MTINKKLSTNKPVVRNRNDRLRVVVTQFEVPNDAITQQQFKDECDMNRIVKNAHRGIAPKYLARGTPQYGDFSNVPTLEKAFDQVERATAAFMNLPAELRLELNNDPANIAALTQDQIKRFKLGKEPTPPSPASPEAGQAVPSSDVKTPKADQSGQPKSTP